jgi:hypothetical protein
LPTAVDHDPVTNRNRNIRLLQVALGGGALVLTAVGASAADPPGNNGTVKVDKEVFDNDPNNEPHVDCVFQIDFDGYDKGDLTADVLFEAWPPTTATPKTLLEQKDIPIGGDEAGGANDNDASVNYDLTNALVAIDPHPAQGWHVKLTVHAEGSIGADTKFKVFWVEGCEVPGTTTTTTTRPGGTTTTTRPDETTTTTKPGNGNGNGPKPRPTPTPPAATPVEPDGPIIFAG